MEILSQEEIDKKIKMILNQTNFNEEKALELLNNNGIIRSKLKIKSSIQNAKRFLEIQKQYGSFNNYIWQYVDQMTNFYLSCK